MNAVRDYLGDVRTAHPVEDGKLLQGRENWRRAALLRALEKSGFTPARIRLISKSLGVRRALYGCRLDEPVGLEPQEEIDEVYDFWRRRYARAP